MTNCFERDPVDDHMLGKPIIQTSLAKTVYNHAVTSLLSGTFKDVIVNPDIAKNYHYRDTIHDKRDRQKLILMVILFEHLCLIFVKRKLKVQCSAVFTFPMLCNNYLKFALPILVTTKSCFYSETRWESALSRENLR